LINTIVEYTPRAGRALDDALEHGVETCSADSDFARFTEVS
jgi:hypothetical protein